ncbi:hypothetical protein UlMin_028087 [Ulmus minor]
MRWHSMGKSKDNDVMQHPVDGKAWQEIDKRHPQFAGDVRNVRLGLAADGFNPFGNMSSSYSMWPVALTTYNLPPWICMKAESLMLINVFNMVDAQNQLVFILCKLEIIFPLAVFDKMIHLVLHLH